MKKLKLFSKGLHVAILALTVFSMSGLGVLVVPSQATAIQQPPQETSKATLQAVKVICDDETYLPNWGDKNTPNRPTIITETTASDWLAQSPQKDHCWLAEDWDFKWKIGDNPSEKKFSVTEPAMIPTDKGIVKVRETLNENFYIPFSGDTSAPYDTKSAEFYCGSDLAHFDNEEWFGTNQNPLETGETYNCVAFNVPIYGSISGFKWNDLNENGHPDNEPKLPDWKIFIDENGNKTYDEGEQFQMTDQNGNYAFEDLPLGKYSVCEVQQYGWAQTSPGNNSCREVNLWRGEPDATHVKFGNAASFATIDAYKIICPTEEVLPDWGKRPSVRPASITEWFESRDAYQWVKDNGCYFSEDWGFEWAYDYASNPGDNAGDTEWQNFNVTSPLELTSLGENKKVWVREVADPAYIDFSGTINTSENQTSAEMYYRNDIRNYDNYDWIAELEKGETYYCVAFNVEKTGTVTLEKNVLWNNGETDISDPTKFKITLDGQDYMVGEGASQTITLPVGSYSAVEDPGTYSPLNNTESQEFTLEQGDEKTITFKNKTMCKPGEGWAYSVVSSNQGLTRDGQIVNNVSPNRSDPKAAVGPEDGNGTGTFFSLGKGGSLTVAFEYVVLDKEGDDISVHEATNGAYPEETALVEVSYDGITWYTLGTASNLNPNDNTYFDLADAGLPIAKYVRLTDTTDFGLFEENSNYANADGFDVDAIDIVYGTCEDVKPSYIQGKKFNDFNGNGNRNAGDTFMNDWTINLYDSSWTLVDSMETGNDNTEAGNVTKGQYRFTNLYPETTYFVCEIQQPGWVQTRPDGSTVNLSENSDEAPYCFEVYVEDNGKKYTNKQFGNFETETISGFKWHDADNFGEWDESEVGLNGWTIFIDANENNVRDEGEIWTTTASYNDGESTVDGFYMFSDLGPGTYRICEVQQEGWEQTFPVDPNCHIVEIPQNQQEIQQYNFGNRTIGDPVIEKTAVVTGGESEAVEIGDTITYTISVTNNYDVEIADLLVEDTLPEHLTLVPGSFSGDYTPSSISGDTYQWGAFTLPGNSSVSMSFDATIDDDITEETTIENIAILYRQILVEDDNAEEDLASVFNRLLGIQTVHAATFELVYIAQSNVNVTVPAPPQPTTPTTPETPGTVAGDTTNPVLKITKTAGVEFTNPGATVTYTVVVENTGDGQALGVTVQDTLPQGLTFSDTGTTNHSWFLGALDVNGKKSVTYDVTVADDAAEGTYVNIAVASADNADNTQDDASVEVRSGDVLGDSVPATGASLKDFFIFLVSVLTMLLGTVFVKQGRNAFKAQ